jgi:hypothetical protein
MDNQITGKLNRLPHLLPEGWVAPAHWLDAHGYSRSLLAQYKARRWLDSPAHGAYVRPGSKLKWQHVVVSIQCLEQLPMHVGGRTALVHRGLAHYLRLGRPEEIHLYGPAVGALPAWTRKLPIPEKLVTHTDAMFGSLPRVYRDETGRFVNDKDEKVAARTLVESGLSEFTWGNWDWSLTYSTTERAILEVLQDVPQRESVYEADALISGLATLRPARLTHLLAHCGSVKVKRLFLALAARHRHAWFAHLDLQKIDLGTGTRMLIPGGRLNPKYGITLPADLDDHLR